MVLGLLILELFSSVAEANNFFLIYEEDKLVQKNVEAQVLLKTLNHALSELRLYAPKELLSDLYLPMKVSINSEVGCNAAWTGDQLLAYKGNEKCASSSMVPTLMVHELGHAVIENVTRDLGRLPRDINEGLADILAAVILNEPLIGKGFYKGYPFHYLRNLNDHMKYASENMRGDYAVSLIFSTLAWDIYKLLLDNYSQEEAKRIFFKILYQHLREMFLPQSRGIQKFSVSFAQRFLPFFSGTDWVLELLQKHGFEGKQKLTSFEYNFTVEGVEFSFPDLSGAQVVILNQKFKQKKSIHKVMVTWSELNLLGSCGQVKSLQAVLVAPNGRHRKFSPFTFKVGRRTKLEKRYVFFGENLSIQDDVIELPFSLDLKQDESVLGLKWFGEIEHFYPGDLRVSLMSEGKFLAGFRGVDEAIIGKEYNFSDTLQGQKASIHMQNIGKGFTGLVHFQHLEVAVLKTSCSN